MMRLIGLAIVAAAVLAAVMAVAPAVSGQANATARQNQDARNLALAVRPELQILAGDGPEIGVTVRNPDKGEGVVVDEVRDGSPASKAGIKAGDVIIEFDGEKVRSVKQLTRLVQETPAGRAAKMAVTQDGKRTDLVVTPESRASGFWTDQFQADMNKLRQDLGNNLRELPRQGGTFRYRVPGPGEIEVFPPEGSSGLIERFTQPGGRLGVTAQDLTPQLGTFFGAKEGVLVTAVTDGSAAAQAGLKAGDVITAVNDHAVKTASDLVRLLREAGDGAEVTLAIVRDHKPTTVKAKLQNTSSSPRIIRRTIVV